MFKLSRLLFLTTLAVLLDHTLLHFKEGGFGVDAADEQKFPVGLENEKLASYLDKKFVKILKQESCTNSDVLAQIKKYKPIVRKIIKAATEGQFKGKTYDDLALYADTFGHRIAGSESLEKSIDYVASLLTKSGATDVTFENVPVPNWRRGVEVATLIEPRKKNVALLGLGMTVATPPEGIEADVVVIYNYTELLKDPSIVKGKIVVLNYAGSTKTKLYSEDSGYTELAKAGAVAALYRPPTPFSLSTPHGRRANFYYDGTSPEIPIAFLTLEDIDLFVRWHERGQKILLHLKLQNTHGNAISRNLFGDLKGSTLPQEYIILSCHTDSWDVGQGVNDNGIGVMLTLEAFRILKTLNLTPKRTIRTAFWTTEEYGYIGAAEHVKNNKEKFGNLSVMMESDSSCFSSIGLAYHGDDELGCILREIVKLTRKVSAGFTLKYRQAHTDTDAFTEVGIPTVLLPGDDGRYYWYHHTEADTMTSVNTEALDRCLALWTSAAYILADLKDKIRRF